MPIPMQRHSAPTPNPAPGTPPQGVNPFNPTTPAAPKSPQFPDYYPTRGPQWEQKLPAEQERFKKILAALDDSSGFIVSVGIGAENPNIVQSQFHALDQMLTQTTGASLGAHRPMDVHETDFNNYRYGLKLDSPEDIEKMVIGHVPSDLIRMSFYSKQYGVDLLHPTLQGNMQGRLQQTLNTVNEGNRVLRERLRRGPSDVAAPGEKLLDEDEAQRRFVTVFGNAITTYMRNNRMYYVNDPNLQPNEIADANGRPLLNQVPIDFWSAMQLYEKYLEGNMEPMLTYARNIGTRIFREGRNPARIEQALYNARPLPQGAIAPSIPLDYDWKVPGADEARRMFMGGRMAKGREIMFLDVASIPGDSFFANRASGEIQPATRELLSRINEYAEKNMGQAKRSKLVLVSPAAVKDHQPGQDSKELGGVKYLDLPKPDATEIENVSIPKWIMQLFKPGRYKLSRQGQPFTPLTTSPEGKTLPTSDGISFVKQIARYANGFTVQGLHEFLSEVQKQAIKHSIGSRLAPSVGNSEPETLDVDFILKYLRENYVARLFEDSKTDNGGNQLKEVFKVVDAKQARPKGMSNPKKIVRLLEDYRKAHQIGSVLESSGNLTLKKLKDIVVKFQLSPAADLGYPSSKYLMEGPQYKLDEQGQRVRNPHIPDDQKCWDELRDDDAPEVREKVKFALQKKKGNFILLTGPGGMGKTSTAAYLADSLDFGFMYWDMCRAKDKWVGNTEKNIEAAFKFVMGLRDYVILLDEVDYCLGGTGGGDGGMSHKSDVSIAEAFRKNWNMLIPVAPKNNLIIVSTSNYPERLSEPDRRRLSRDKGGEISIDYFKDDAQLAQLVETIINRYMPTAADPGDPMFATFDKLRMVYTQALIAEAKTKKAPYSNDEVDRLFSSWVDWNRSVVATEIGEQHMWNPETLVYMVQKSGRQSKNGALKIVEPPADFVLHGGNVPKEQLPAPGVVSVPGFQEMGPGGPPGGPAPAAAPAGAPAAPPRANDVDLDAWSQQAENTVLPQAPKPGRRAEILPMKQQKVAAFETAKPSIKLLAVAENIIDQAQGFKYVRDVPAMSGMLFKYQSPKVLSFWMQDTYVPLDIAFIDHEGMIVKTERMVPMSLRSVTSGRPCVMALEVAAGTLDRIGFTVGKKLKIDLESKTVQIDD